MSRPIGNVDFIEISPLNWVPVSDIKKIVRIAGAYEFWMRDGEIFNVIETSKLDATLLASAKEIQKLSQPEHFQK